MKSFLQRLYALLALCARPLRQEAGLVLLLLDVQLVAFHLIGLPSRRQAGQCLADYLLTLYLLAATLCLLPHRLRPWVRGAAVGVLLLIAGTEAFLRQRFHMVFEPTMFCLVAETDGEETGEFLRVCLRSKAFWSTLTTFVCLLLTGEALCEAGGWLKRRVARRLSPCATRLVRHTATLILAVAALVLIVTTVRPWAERRSDMLGFLCSADSGKVERVSSRPYYSSPMRLLYCLKFWGLMQQEGQRFADNTLRALEQAPVQTADSLVAKPEIVVVIGESYNKYHAQIYGYDRPTTPTLSRLKRQGTLVAFIDVVSPYNVTSQVFKWVFSTASVGHDKSWADGIFWPALFRRAGWSVSFVTNQYVPSSRQNKIDYSGSFFLNAQPLDSLAFSHRNCHKYQYDGPLLGELSDTLPQPTLQIVHLIGQHMDAALRVPASWKKWKASDYNRPDLKEAQRQTLADYDNATRYNDEVLRRLIKRYRNREAVLIYFSDHGEEVYDAPLRMYGRNHRSHPSADVVRHEYEVPFFVWTSAAFRRTHPRFQQRLRAAAALPFMTDDLCHILFGMAQLPTPYYRADRDPLSPDYRTDRPRLLKDRWPYGL